MNADVLVTDTKTKFCLLFLGRRLAHSLSSISTQYSSDNDSHAETMKDDVKDTEEYDIKRASDNVAHVQHGNESGENKLLRVEENQETFALEKERIDEEKKENPEDLTAREDTGVFHDNIMAIQCQSTEVNGELRLAGSVESHTEEDGAKNGNTRRDDGEQSLIVPSESSVLEAEDSREESAGGAGVGGESRASAQPRVTGDISAAVFACVSSPGAAGECGCGAVRRLLECSVLLGAKPPTRCSLGCCFSSSVSSVWRWVSHIVKLL